MNEPTTAAEEFAPRLQGIKVHALPIWPPPVSNLSAKTIASRHSSIMLRSFNSVALARTARKRMSSLTVHWGYTCQRRNLHVARPVLPGKMALR
jgi:hypothetical protein